MSPLKEISKVQASFLRELLAKFGSAVDGQAFRVAFGETGEERIIVVGEKTIVSNVDVLEGVSDLLAGAALFGSIPAVSTESHPGINLVEIDPSMKLHDLFQGESVRIPNALHRGGIKTVGEALEFLQSQDGEEKLDALREVGPKTIAEIKRKLGLE